MRFDRRIMLVYSVALALLAVGAFGFRAGVKSLGIFLQKEPVELRADFSTIPTVVGQWRRVGEDHLEDAASVEALGTKQYLTRNYALDGDVSKGVISLHIAYYTGGIDTVPHIPDRCWAANGLVQMGSPEVLALDLKFQPEDAADTPVNRATGKKYAFGMASDPVTRRIQRVPMPVGDLGLTTVTFQDPKSPRVRQLGGYFFIANGRASATTTGVRMLAFNLTDRFSYYCKVQLSARYPETNKPEPKEAFKAQAEQFLRDLMPQLMRCLPDWPEVEARDAQRASSANPEQDKN